MAETMKNNQEFSLAEREKNSAKIRLEFFRHDEKAKPSENYTGPRIGDELVRISQEGRNHATEVGKTKSPRPEVGLAYGSPRERTIETSLRQMLAGEDRITAESSLEDIRAVVESELKKLKLGKKAKKEIMTEKLDFNWNGTSEFNQIGYRRYLETKDALKFLVDDSDQLVYDLKDKVSTSYSRAAGNIAELVQKYLNILPRWQKIIEENP